MNQASRIELIQQVVLPASWPLVLETESPAPPVMTDCLPDTHPVRRRDKLCSHLPALPSAPGFDELLAEYCATTRPAAFDSGSGDAEHLVRWLAQHGRLDDVQADYLAVQAAYSTLQRALRRQRLAYLHFCRRYERSDAADATDAATVHLNPIRYWAQLRSEALLCEPHFGGPRPPLNVLFFASRNRLAAAVLELEGQALLNELADFQPCTFGQWSAMSALAGPDQARAFAGALHELGLAAVEA